MRSNIRMFVAIGFISSFGLLATQSALAQHGAMHTPAGDPQHHQATPRPNDAATARYDARTETTVAGSIAEVSIPAHGAASGATPQDGTLLLRTEAGTVRVQLAPPAFLAENSLTLTPGEAVTVIGSRLGKGPSQVVIARELRKGQTSWMLRDTSGTPLWSSTAHGSHR